MILKNSFFLAFIVLMILALQALASYWSYRAFSEGNLCLGFSLFLSVPCLALVVVFYFFWFRRRCFRGKGKTGEMEK